MDDLTGQRLNDYQLLRLLGRGAMASVYLADQASLARQVAVKVLNADLAKDDAAVERFQHEARAAAALVHANIVQVYEVGTAQASDGEWRYLVQEYVPGGTLGQQVQRKGPLSPGQTLGVLWQVASALSVAAHRGIVHRDIKPDNLMVDRSGDVKVADFGLARLVQTNDPRRTQAGVALGTPLYMSPEQIEGRDVDSRSDLYSLGVTVYHLLTGEPPFSGDTPLSVAVRHLNEAPQPVAQRREGLPPELAAVIDRLMAKSPEDRFASPEDLCHTLRQIASQAEAEGWAEGKAIDASALSSSVHAVAHPSTRKETRELSEAMQKETALARSARGGRSRWWSIGGGILLGTALALLLGRNFSLLPEMSRSAVEREATVKEQLYRAKIVGTPAAWQAVENFFPDAPEFYHLLAQRGYAGDLLAAEKYRLAVPALEQLADRKADQPEFAHYGQAGLIVAFTQLGREAKAREVLGQLSGDAAKSLQKQSPGLAAQLRRAIAKLNGSKD